MTENLSVSLDKIDLKILKLIQRKGKMTIPEIAKKVKPGISAVHTRIKRMESTGVIQKFTAVVDPVLLKRPTLAFILVTVRYRLPGTDTILSQRAFCQEIARHPYVLGVHVLSGEYDVLLKVRAENIEKMNRFIVDFLRQIPAVEKTLTMFAMDTYHDSLELRDLK